MDSDKFFEIYTLRGKDIVHFELQAQNHPDMWFRMMNYGVNIYHQHQILPHQFVIYIGTEPLNYG